MNDTEKKSPRPTAPSPPHTPEGPTAYPIEKNRREKKNPHSLPPCVSPTTSDQTHAPLPPQETGDQAALSAGGAGLAGTWSIPVTEEAEDALELGMGQPAQGPTEEEVESRACLQQIRLRANACWRTPGRRPRPSVQARWRRPGPIRAGHPRRRDWGASALGLFKLETCGRGSVVLPPHGLSNNKERIASVSAYTCSSYFVGGEVRNPLVDKIYKKLD